MPCEGCNTQFTVFKRKRNCAECRRYYCNQCLTKRNNFSLCERCLIFTKRPLHKTDLQKLKSKDLIFYLQSKQISTTGCVEKDELVNLILMHVNSVSSNSSSNSNSSRHNSGTDFTKRDSPNNDGDHTNPFIQLKQSCQSFFSTVTDKITSDLNFTDSKCTSPNRSNQHQQNNTDDPRVIIREIPTYSSNLDSRTNQRQTFSATFQHQPSGNGNIVPHNENHLDASANTPSNTSSSSSPILSLSSISSQSISSQQQHLQQQQQSKPNRNPLEIPTVHTNRTTANNRRVFHNVLNSIHDGTNGSGSTSGCECSDDEIITKFQEQQEKTRDRLSSPTSPGLASEQHIPGPSRSFHNNTSPSSHPNHANLQQDLDNSSGSSFEELGAVGGNLNKSNCNKNGAGSSGTTTSSDAENWQLIDNENSQNLSTNENGTASESFPSQSEAVTSLVVFDENNSRFNRSSARQRRILRRRSDGFIYSLNRSAGYEALDFGIASGSGNISRVEEEDSDEENDDDDGGGGGGGSSSNNNNNSGGAALSSGRKRLKSSCTKCGKTKKNLKRHVAKFKRHLESTQMSEMEIKEELKAFLEYLECRAKSFECSDDSESNAEILTEIDLDATDYDDERFLNDDDGIHVYGHDDCDDQCNQSRFDSRFLGLTDFQTLDDFDELTVKQLKEILMLNRIDFKGCCEKQELLERVHRLWKNLQECPAVDKLQVDDLCKICMDAPIECVILECGHMATCTSCGKVLSECPICRQYIVRVVRFFRA